MREAWWIYEEGGRGWSVDEMWWQRVTGELYMREGVEKDGVWRWRARGNCGEAEK